MGAEENRDKELNEKYEILFGEEPTLNAGTYRVIFNQRHVFLKDKITGTIIPTNRYVSSGEDGTFSIVDFFHNSEE